MQDISKQSFIAVIGEDTDLGEQKQLVESLFHQHACTQSVEIVVRDDRYPAVLVRGKKKLAESLLIAEKELYLREHERVVETLDLLRHLCSFHD
ncbi:MAG: hypothetical protein WC471_03565 [Candidatus Woesearchaeota archaeon]